MSPTITINDGFQFEKFCNHIGKRPDEIEEVRHVAFGGFRPEHKWFSVNTSREDHSFTVPVLQFGGPPRCIVQAKFKAETLCHNTMRLYWFDSYFDYSHIDIGTCTYGLYPRIDMRKDGALPSSPKHWKDEECLKIEIPPQYKPRESA